MKLSLQDAFASKSRQQSWVSSIGDLLVTRAVKRYKIVVEILSTLALRKDVM
jgi:hypothetical protein